MFFSVYSMNPVSWTEGARFCYRRGCTCTGCYMREILETKCLMKIAVMKLIDKFGAPPPESPYTQSQKQIIKAITQGANTPKEIAKKTKLPLESVKTQFKYMYEIARTDGFREIDKRNILPEYIMWVRERKIYDSL